MTNLVKSAIASLIAITMLIGIGLLTQPNPETLKMWEPRFQQFHVLTIRLDDTDYRTGWDHTPDCPACTIARLSPDYRLNSRGNHTRLVLSVVIIVIRRGALASSIVWNRRTRPRLNRETLDGACTHPGHELTAGTVAGTAVGMG